MTIQAPPVGALVRAAVTTKLIITIGLPGSLKSTWARAEAARSGAQLVSRDELRAMMCPGPWPHGYQAWEDTCTAAQLGMIRGLLLARVSVNPVHRAVLAEVAAECGAEYTEKDFRDVPLERCIYNDAARPYPVGEAVIRRLHGLWIASREEAGKP